MIGTIALWECCAGLKPGYQFCGFSPGWYPSMRKALGEREYRRCASTGSCELAPVRAPTWTRHWDNTFSKRWCIELVHTKIVYLDSDIGSAAPRVTCSRTRICRPGYRFMLTPAEKPGFNRAGLWYSSLSGD